MSVMGTRVLRTEDPRLLTAGGTYVADLEDPLLEGAAQVVYVRSTMAHATFDIDVRDARKMPGVVDVLTAADITGDAGLADIPGTGNAAMSRPYLARGTVRFVGEPVAVVIAESIALGVDAAELVAVDYDPLPVVVDPEEAASDDVVLFPDVGTNCAIELSFGRSDDLFDDCEVVVTEKVLNQRVAICPLEVRGAAAAWAPDGRLYLWISTQGAHGVQSAIAGVYGLETSEVRIIAPDVGGGFGAKISATPEETLLPELARRLGRPMRWTETRTENMLAMGHGRGQVQLVEIGGRRDGTVEAYRLSILQDSGAYPNVGTFLPYLSRMMAPGVYAIPKVECNTSAVVTNTTPTVAYRGAGRPEAAAAIERAMDLFAYEIGMDPAELRRRNLIPAFDEPHTTPVGTSYDCGDYAGALDRVLGAAGYEELRAEQERRRAANDPKAIGIGVSVYVEVTAGPTAGGEHATIEINPDGTATVYSGASSHGQGHQTAFAMIANEQTGIPIEKITVVQGDTDRVVRGEGTMGSRSLQLGGSAVLHAAEQVIEQARTFAADALEASPHDIVLDTAHGRFHVTGTPARSMTWAEIATVAQERDEELRAAFDFHAESTTFPFGAHVAVVEVDTETGEVTLERMITCDDAGRIINPLLVEGQRHGGIAQGVAQALIEEMCFDESGNPLTANFADYGFISAAELPSFELVPMETPTPVNPLGAKGIGESGTIGSTPAVQSAVCDALRHLGIRHIDIPCTPERVWRAINE